eukprot:1160511-Pelagomonas_calceolata.AAC.3
MLDTNLLQEAECPPSLKGRPEGLSGQGCDVSQVHEHAMPRRRTARTLLESSFQRETLDVDEKDMGQCLGLERAIKSSIDHMQNI